MDTVIVAVGQGPNPLVPSTTPGLATNKWGNIVTDDTQQTSRPGVYAGGDWVRGGSTVILAMGDGKRAARAIHEFLYRVANQDEVRGGLRPPIPRPITHGGQRPPPEVWTMQSNGGRRQH
jgi:pyruvate/2-oxoglutarate dehydrogenase complex dihydrolipoamide dehydrogenase (E3) component